MRDLEWDIAWHREQIRAARLALKEAGKPFGSMRILEVETLTGSVRRLERTLEQLEALRFQT